MRPYLIAIAAASLVAVLAAPVAARPPWEGRPPYGRDLMTRAERKTYRLEFQALQTDAERDTYYSEHVEKMKHRAWERGVAEPVVGPNLSDDEQPVTFWRAPYFEDMMTPEERANYAPALDAIPDRLDRWRFVAKHIRTMYARGIERGVTVPPTDRFANVFEALGEEPPDARARTSANETGSAAATGDADADEAEAPSPPVP